MNEQDAGMKDEEEREALYTFWDRLPKASFFDMPKHVLESHPARRQILKILKQGRDDGQRLGTRYALNAQEIRELLKDKSNITLSTTNVYFHLKTLEEHKLIHVVSTILEKRHKVAFFGRSAQNLFIRDAESRLQRYVDLADEFSKFAKVLKLDFDYKKLRAIPEDYHNLKRRREEIIGEWISNNEEIIERENLDINEIFDFMKLIDSINPEYLGMFQEFQSFLDSIEGNTTSP